MAGVKGRSGRKSEFKERADADGLWKLWMEKLDSNEIQQLLQKGKFSLRDAFIAKARNGSERLMSEVFRKLYPDSSKIEMNGNFDLGDLLDKVDQRMKDSKNTI